MDRGPLPAVVLSAIEVAGRVADEQEVTVKNHRMRREPDPSTRNTRAERLPDPISGNLLDEDPPDAIERAIENAASPAPKAAPAAPHEPGSAQPAPDPAGLREAAQAALDEWDAATKDWMEWWARGGKGFHQFPVAAANHLRAALASSDSLRLDPEDPDVVERLARAIGTATDCGHSSCASGRDTSRHLDDALAIAREWKASALPDRRSGLDRRHGPGADLPNVHERRSTHRRKGDWEAHIARASALPDPAPEAQA